MWGSAARTSGARKSSQLIRRNQANVIPTYRECRQTARRPSYGTTVAPGTITEPSRHPLSTFHANVNTQTMVAMT